MFLNGFEFLCYLKKNNKDPGKFPSKIISAPQEIQFLTALI